MREVPELNNLLEPVFTTTGVGVVQSRRGGWYVVQLYALLPVAR